MKLKCYAKCPDCGTEAKVEELGNPFGFIAGNCPKCKVRFVATSYWWQME